MRSGSGDTSFLLTSARVFGLCGFVFASPLLNVLGDNPTFFVAHDVDGIALVEFGVALILIPALVMIAGLGIVHLVARSAMPVVSAVVIGALAALAIVPIIDRTGGLSTAAFVVLLLTVAIATAWAYHRRRGLRVYTTYLAPAPLLFLVIFLIASPSSALLSGAEDVDAAALHGSNTPVVFVVFDEFPLGVLLDTNGAIDAARYPGFARLATHSTWYPKAVTVSPWTVTAVPAVMTGSLPSAPVPVAASYPRSVFTLFARSHRLEVSEAAVTQVCPEDLCAAQSADQAELAHDTSVVFLHSLLPDDLAADWLPRIGERWSGFSDEPPEKVDYGKDVTIEEFESSQGPTVVEQLDQQPARFAQMVASISAGGERPGLWFHHSLLPHVPYQHLPDGRAYGTEGLPPQESQSGRWIDDDDLRAGRVQRLAIQTQLVDHLVSALLDQLEEQGLFDDALVVVTADHGVTFDPGNGPRGAPSATASNPPPLEQPTLDDVLPVPLFIKYPGESTGRVDGRDAQTIDVLPTLVDSLDLTLPPGWAFDGRSLLGDAPKQRPVRFITDDVGEQRITIRTELDPLKMARLVQSTITGPSGTDHDLYRLEPYGALVGQPAAPLVIGDPVGTVLISPADVYDNVNLTGVVPALLQAEVSGVGDEDWVAVAVNGTIAGTGPAYLAGGALQVVAMLDPSLLRNGRNTVDVYRIDSPTELRPLTRR